MTMPDGTSPPPPGPPTGPPPPPAAPGYPPPAAPGYPPAGPAQPYVPAGPTGYTQPPMTPPKRSRRTGLIALGVLVVLVLLIVGGLAYFRDSISGDVNALAVGDCIDQPTSSDAITDVQHHPCGEPHDGEVFAVLTYPGGPDASYPILTSDFQDFVRAQCIPAIQTYTGRTVEEIDAAGLTYAYFYPTMASWDDNDDRGVTCYVIRNDDQQMTGSVKAGAPSSP